MFGFNKKDKKSEKQGRKNIWKDIETDDKDLKDRFIKGITEDEDEYERDRYDRDVKDVKKEMGVKDSIKDSKSKFFDEEELGDVNDIRDDEVIRDDGGNRKDYKRDYGEDVEAYDVYNVSKSDDIESQKGQEKYDSDVEKRNFRDGRKDEYEEEYEDEYDDELSEKADKKEGKLRRLKGVFSSKKKVILFLVVGLIFVAGLGVLFLDFLMGPKKSKKTITSFSSIPQPQVQVGNLSLSSNQGNFSQGEQVSNVTTSSSQLDVASSGVGNMSSASVSNVSAVSNGSAMGVVNVSGASGMSSSSMSQGQVRQLSQSNQSRDHLSKSMVIEQKGAFQQGQVSEDIFLAFFRSKKQSSESEGVKGKDITQKELPTIESNLPGLPGLEVPTPPLMGNVNLDSIRVYGVICNDRGECFAETNLGRLRKGDRISNGMETVIFISKNEIKTNFRIINF